MIHKKPETLENGEIRWWMDEILME